MVVMILENVPASFRGELTRWMIQPKAGVFVGNISGMVRDKLWQRAARTCKKGGGILVHSSNTEQGFAVQTFGDLSREMVDIEGIILARTPSER
jgi:CRISPR-associated protein Cas2